MCCNFGDVELSKLADSQIGIDARSHSEIVRQSILRCYSCPIYVQRLFLRGGVAYRKIIKSMKIFLSVPNLRSSSFHPDPASATHNNQILKRFNTSLCTWVLDKKNGDPIQLRIAADRIHKAMCGNTKILDLRGLNLHFLPECIALLPRDVELLGCYETKYVEQILNAWSANPVNGSAADREQAKKRIKRAFESETLETLLNLADLRLASLPDCIAQLPDGLHLHVAHEFLIPITLPKYRSKVVLGQPQKQQTKVSNGRDKKFFKQVLNAWAEDSSNGSVADRTQAKERIMNAWHSKTLETLLNLADLDLKTLPGCIAQLPAGLHLHVTNSWLGVIALPPRSKLIMKAPATILSTPSNLLGMSDAGDQLHSASHQRKVIPATGMNTGLAMDNSNSQSKVLP